MPGQSPPATGPCRFGRQLHPPVLALGLQNGPERRASLGWNERKFLSLTTNSRRQDQIAIHECYEVVIPDTFFTFLAVVAVAVDVIVSVTTEGDPSAGSVIVTTGELSSLMMKIGEEMARHPSSPD